MIQFVKVPKKLGTLEPKDRYLAIAVYFAIRSRQDSITLKARYSQEHIADQLGICKRDVIKALEILKKNKLITVEQLKSKNNAFEFSQYSFIDYDNFEMIDVNFLYEKIPAKYKGLLIYIKLNCEANWYRYKNITDFASKIGVTRKTASKYLKDLDKYIEPSKVEGLHFTSKLFTLKEQETIKSITL